MKRFLDYGGTATCSQLAVKYGEKANFYNMGSTQLAKRIHEKTNCPLIGESENSKWWPVLYVGKVADTDTKGVYVWELREELVEALQRYDFSEVDLYPPKVVHDQPRGFWWLMQILKSGVYHRFRLAENMAIRYITKAGIKGGYSRIS